jgi:hypothetical protein
VVSFLLAFPTKSYIHSSPPCVLHALPIPSLNNQLKIWRRSSSSASYLLFMSIFRDRTSNTQIIESRVYIVPLWDAALP